MSIDSDRTTYLRRAFTTLRPSDAPRPDCPPAGQIWDGVHGQLGPTQLRELVHHVASCPVCTHAWTLAEKVEESPEEEAPPQPHPTPSWTRPVAAAAAATLALAIGIHWRSTPTPAGTSRGEAIAVRTSPGEEIELLTEGPLQRDDAVLRWTEIDRASSYIIRVKWSADPSRVLAEHEDVKEAEYRIPPEALEGLPPDSRLSVYIQAVAAKERLPSTFYVAVE